MPEPLSDNASAILDEATRVDGTPPVSDQALLAARQGARTVIDFGEAVGIVGQGELDLVVRPSARGRGLGRRALRELLALEQATGDLRAWAHGENPAADVLLRGAGFSPVRTLLRMVLPPERLSAAIAESRPLPEGFDIVPFTLGDERLAAAWVRVNAAAFADHPEQGNVTREDFDAMTREPWFIADDLRFAVDRADGRVAGFEWVKTTEDGGETETELYVLGVDPAFAGRGLGAALLGETLRSMAAHQPTRITLYVDGDNANAVSLYERAGFEVEQRSVQWLRAAQDELC